MTQSDDILRRLIRLIPPARAIKEEVDKALVMETYQGTGSAAIRTFGGLQQAVATLTDDPYVATMTVDDATAATEREQVSQVALLAAQLVAYLEGQTGLMGGLGGGGKATYHTAPTVNIANIKGMPPETVDRMIRLSGGQDEDRGEDEGEDSDD